MQDTPDVGWDPISINHHLPFNSRLFILYLLLVGTYALVKLAGSIRDLRSLSAFARTSSDKSEQKGEITAIWDACWVKLQTMKRSAVLTFLLAVLAAADQAKTDLVYFTVQKTTGIASFSGSIAEVLATFALGILACTIIYAIYAFCEGLLIQRKFFR